MIKTEDISIYFAGAVGPPRGFQSYPADFPIARSKDKFSEYRKLIDAKYQEDGASRSVVYSFFRYDMHTFNGRPNSSFGILLSIRGYHLYDGRVVQGFFEALFEEILRRGFIFHKHEDYYQYIIPDFNEVRTRLNTLTETIKRQFLEHHAQDIRLILNQPNDHSILREPFEIVPASTPMAAVVEEGEGAGAVPKTTGWRNASKDETAGEEPSDFDSKDEKAKKTPKRRRLVVSALAACLLIVLAVGGWWIYNLTEKNRRLENTFAELHDRAKQAQSEFETAQEQYNEARNEYQQAFNEYENAKTDQDRAAAKIKVDKADEKVKKAGKKQEAAANEVKKIDAELEKAEHGSTQLDNKKTTPDEDLQDTQRDTLGLMEEIGSAPSKVESETDPISSEKIQLPLHVGDKKWAGDEYVLYRVEKGTHSYYINMKNFIKVTPFLKSKEHFLKSIRDFLGKSQLLDAYDFSLDAAMNNIEKINKKDIREITKKIEEVKKDENSDRMYSLESRLKGYNRILILEIKE